MQDLEPRWGTQPEGRIVEVSRGFHAPLSSQLITKAKSEDPRLTVLRSYCCRPTLSKYFRSFVFCFTNLLSPWWSHQIWPEGSLLNSLGADTTLTFNFLYDYIKFMKYSLSPYLYEFSWWCDSCSTWTFNVNFFLNNIASYEKDGNVWLPVTINYFHICKQCLFNCIIVIATVCNIWNQQGQILTDSETEPRV